MQDGAPFPEVAGHRTAREPAARAGDPEVGGAAVLVASVPAVARSVAGVVGEPVAPDQDELPAAGDLVAEELAAAPRAPLLSTRRSAEDTALEPPLEPLAYISNPPIYRSIVFLI